MKGLLRKINTERPLFRKTVYEETFKYCDDWGTDEDIQEYTVRIYIFLTLGGIVWGIDIPNWYTGDHNLFRAIARTIDYVEKKGIAYTRLSDIARKMSFWKWL